MKPSPYTNRYSPQEVDHYYSAGLWSTETFHDLLVRRVEENPDKVFATDGTRSLTFRELFDAGQRLAIGLHRQGLRRGDTAAVQLPNWVEFIQVLAALSRLGVIMVPIMPIYRREDVGYVLSNADVRAVFAPANFSKFNYLDMYLGLRQQHPDLTIVVARPDSAAESIIGTESAVFSLQSLEADTDDNSARQELGAPPGPDEPFVIVYTSGTTSRPKGCVHTFNTYCSGSRALIGPFGYTEDDVQFGPSPIAHTTGLVTSVLLPMLTGASTHLMARWDPARGIEEIQRFGCTAAVTAPTFLHTLLSEYDAERHNLSTLRLWTCAGAPIPAAVIERAGATLPNMKVLSLYGRSENLVTSTCSVTDDVLRALTSDGKAMPGAEVKIVNADGNEAPRGAEGDIAYRGPAHMIEYLAKPEETADPVHQRRLFQVRRSGGDDRGRIRAGNRSNQRHRHSRRDEHQRPRDRGASGPPSCVEGVLGAGHARREARRAGVLLCGARIGTPAPDGRRPARVPARARYADPEDT